MRPIVSKKNIIQQAVNRLKNLGFVNVTSANIMQDEVYLYYFLKMLREDLSNELVPNFIVKELLNEIDSLHAVQKKEKQ